MDIQQNKRIIRRKANIGLYCSIAAALIAIAFYYLCPWHFSVNNTALQWITIGGTVLAVVTIASALFTFNRKPRQIRQIDAPDERFEQYASMISSIYSTMMGLNIVLCIATILVHDNMLLIFVLLDTLLLFLSYPNMYKIKVDLGLTHEQMHEIYGDEYVDGESDQQ